MACVLCNGSGCAWCSPEAAEAVSITARRPWPPAVRYGLTLWRLAKLDHITTARTGWHPRGLELRIYSGDALVRSKLFPPGEEATLEAEADGERSDLLALGWTPV